MKKNDIIEHLFDKKIIDEDTKRAIYSYYLIEEANQKLPDVIYV